MDMIKNIVKEYYSLLIILSCILFVISVFFSAPIYGGEGIFEGGGNMFSSMLGEDDVKNDGLSYIDGVNSDIDPLIIYNSGAQNVGECIKFKELFLVETEGNFTLYLTDIRNAEGDSVLETLSTEEIANMEEIPAPFVYDKKEDLLYFYGSGIYTVYIKVYESGGGQEAYEFELPVEAM